MIKRVTAIALTAVLSSAGTAALLVALPAAAHQDPGSEENGGEESEETKPKRLFHCAPGRFLAGLVGDGTITAEQADAIHEALRATVRDRERGSSKDEAIESALAGLVEDGTLMQHQADAVQTAIEERRAAMTERRQALRERMRERRIKERFERFRDRGGAEDSTFAPRWTPPGDTSAAA